ncbi:MAG: hypothetical protein Hyperionvirus4_42 [Hyperionvirus sp.]|uniref:Uncharacterized protein n=1 Tax=Hyperionvirus sp. TaxID=2487770 RepID=A0A3G5A761_9VIRU|nr:MAG: hypothetical protein Hyperionvirus4_42 [Hyperionvirus sp.]
MDQKELTKYCCMECNREFICSCSYEEDIPAYKRTCALFNMSFPRSYTIRNADDPEARCHLCSYNCRHKQLFEMDLFPTLEANPDGRPIRVADLPLYDYVISRLPENLHSRIIFDPSGLREKNTYEVFKQALLNGLQDQDMEIITREQNRRDKEKTRKRKQALKKKTKLKTATLN